MASTTNRNILGLKKLMIFSMITFTLMRVAFCAESIELKKFLQSPIPGVTTDLSTPYKGVFKTVFNNNKKYWEWDKPEKLTFKKIGFAKDDDGFGKPGPALIRLFNDSNGVMPAYQASLPSLKKICRIVTPSDMDNCLIVMPGFTDAWGGPLHTTRNWGGFCLTKEGAIHMITVFAGIHTIDKQESIEDMKVYEGYFYPTKQLSKHSL